MRVKRGLLATEASVLPQANEDPADRAEKKVAYLQTLPIGHGDWRETWKFFRVAASHRPIDMRGRRLWSDEAVAKARYVARIARRAMKGRLPQRNQWGYLRTALQTVYADLR